jgi:hypothetical protein
MSSNLHILDHKLCASVFDIFLMDTLHGCMHADYVKVKFIYRYKAEISLLC